LRSIDDYDDMQAWAGIGEAVFAFKDEAPATFDTFLVLIPNTSDANLHQFELLAANESPTEAFSSIVRFETQNVRMMNAPFQAFKFEPVKARYLNVGVLTDFRDREGSAAMHKFQSMGSFDRRREGTGRTGGSDTSHAEYSLQTVLACADIADPRFIHVTRAIRQRVQLLPAWSE
jgi:hypothetical protein